VALIVGVGPGLGQALGEAFAAAGWPVALAARSDLVDKVAADLREAGRRCLALRYDAADAAAVATAVAEAGRELGPVGLLVYNAGNMVRGDVQDVEPEAFRQALEVGPYGAFLHARSVLPGMVERGHGTLLFTGATSALRAPARAPAFAAAKFGLRGLAMSLARRWGPQGIHVAHVVVDGVIRTPRARAYLAPNEPALEPRELAAAYVALARQPRSAWTFELDLRPSGDDIGDN
jgi:NAD(P)-dependent dehydrogenase (short-subunit alcohol dehydrogenase family)